jgi:hypothetical protein
VSLVQSALESRGVATVSLTVLPDITRRLMPPRALAVPFGLGEPLGRPNDPALQRRIIEAAFALLPRTDVPVLETYDSQRT